MEKRTVDQLRNIPADKFKLVRRDSHISDQKLEIKRIGYFGDVWRRFKHDKSALVAFILIIILLLFSIIVPLLSYTDVSFREENYAFVLPKISLFSGSGFWDGTRYESSKYQGSYDFYQGLGVESGMSAIVGDVKTETSVNAKGVQEPRYSFRVDTYAEPGYEIRVVPEEDYRKMLAYQQETGKQIFFPIPKTYNVNFNGFKKGNIWYVLDLEAEADGEVVPTLENTKGTAKRDENGNLIPNYLRTDTPVDDTLPEEKWRYPTDYYPEDAQRIAGDDGSYVYALKVQGGYRVRYNIYNEYVMRYQHEPSFVFGTNVYGQDIFACLAYGGRLSFILAISVSLINFIIGACYGAIEGYYGGAVDMIMEVAAVRLRPDRVDRHGIPCPHAVLPLQGPGVRAGRPHPGRLGPPPDHEAHLPQLPGHDHHRIDPGHPGRHLLRVDAELPEDHRPGDLRHDLHRHHAGQRSALPEHLPAHHPVPRAVHLHPGDFLQPVRQRSARCVQPIIERSG